MVAVELETRWAGFVLHVLSMMFCGAPVYSLALMDAASVEANRQKDMDKQKTCLHSLPLLISATACLVFLSGPSAVFAVPLSKVTGRAYDANSGVFWGFRCGMM